MSEKITRELYDIIAGLALVKECVKKEQPKNYEAISKINVAMNLLDEIFNKGEVNNEAA